MGETVGVPVFVRIPVLVNDGVLVNDNVLVGVAVTVGVSTSVLVGVGLSSANAGEPSKIDPANISDAMNRIPTPYQK